MYNWLIGYRNWEGRSLKTSHFRVSQTSALNCYGALISTAALHRFRRVPDGPTAEIKGLFEGVGFLHLTTAIPGLFCCP